MSVRLSRHFHEYVRDRALFERKKCPKNWENRSKIRLPEFIEKFDF